MQFSYAMWAKALQGPKLPKSALCYYGGDKKNVLYSIMKFQNPPTGGSWKVSPWDR